MGADAKLFLFDCELYRNSIVPAFQRLMRDGSMDQWLLELLETQEDEPDLREGVGASGGFIPFGFWDCCTYLDSEFGVTKIFARPNGEYNGSWETRACRDSVCSFAVRVPFTTREASNLTVQRTIGCDGWRRPSCSVV
jgi:hypothetical protein